MALPNPRGSVFVEIEVSGRWSLSLLTYGWSDDKKRALLDGDAGAREALRDAAIQWTMRKPDAADAITFDVRIEV